jgi:hypothetical protein
MLLILKNILTVTLVVTVKFYTLLAAAKKGLTANIKNQKIMKEGKLYGM